MPAEDIDLVDWWSSLNHGGLLIAPPRIPEFFSGALDRMPMYRVERLRRDVTRVQADTEKGLSAFLDTVFEDLLALPPTQWQKAAAVDKRFSHPAVTGEIVRPFCRCSSTRTTRDASALVADVAKCRACWSGCAR